MIRRRDFALGAAAAVLAPPARAERPALDEMVRRITGGAALRPGRVTLDVPPLVENGNAVPLAVAVDSPMSEADHVRAIHVVNEKNPQPQVISAVLGLAYLLLAMRRNRWCWVAGGVSSAMLAYLSLRAQLPMQAALQIYYVAMSVYGYWYWSRTSAQSGQAITVWPASRHLLACAAVVVASILSARWLARETQAAWPYLDSLTTWGSLLATWLVARVKLENWLYWVLIDAALVFLFAAQALYLFALLNALYVVIAFAGFLSWQKSYRTVRAQAVS